MTDIDAILDEVVRLSHPPEIEPDEFTVYDYLKHLVATGRMRPDRSTAQERLDKLAEKGILRRRSALCNNRRCVVYRLVSQET